MKEQFGTTILGGETVGQFIAYLLFSILGIICSLLIERMRHNNTVKASGGFSIKIWIVDNWIRVVLSVIAMFMICTASTQVLNMTPSTWTAFSGGLVIDKVVEAIIKMKSTLTVRNNNSSN